ncbi:phospholipid-transporting ATPase ABCA3 isoform X1 [Neodiprion pinetum]|uniref:phospholipid-transporting ATPase ABCA3 isoform X1 n=2 Tax=Neodiprion pinetum TaxID=441929 RepID=UPI001EDCAF88|nr:phospholipid-transporting ATPase ABCA1 isoform X1 [Neodiprion pinetum]
MTTQRTIPPGWINVPIFFRDKNFWRFVMGVRWISTTLFYKHIYTKMGDGWRIMYLLLHKNLIIRKRHWIGTIAEVVTPACIIAIIMALRTLIPSGTTVVTNSTIYPVQNRTYLESNFFPDLLRIFYLPQNDFTTSLMENSTECLGIASSQLYGFDTESTMLEGYEAQQAQDLTISVLVVVFEGTVGDSVQNLVYTMKTSRSLKSSLVDSDYGMPSTVADTLIDEIPFVALQMCVDDSFISRVAPAYAEQMPTRSLQKMPYPPYESADLSELFFRDTIGTWAAIMFIVTLYLVPSYITTEKDTGVNALLKMNGVKTYQNFLSWLIIGFVLGTVAVLLITIVVKVYFTSSQLPFYYYSNGFIFWMAILINFIHTYAFCLHVASYFTKARIAQATMMLIVFVVLQVVNQLETNELYSVLPYLGFLFPTAAAMRIFDEFNSYDNLLIGVQWNNLFLTEHEVLGFDGTLGFIMIFSIVATIFHFLIALYLDAVLPGKYGVGKSPFFFLKAFKKNKVNNGQSNDVVLNGASNGQPKVLEHVAEGALTPGIQIRNLEKTYTIGYLKSQTVQAVRGISLDFYKGQITALLGHNGAGKTTTMSILTGLTSPTSGTVLVNGKNINSDMQAIRDDLGMCPQENMLFSDLTVMEQLQLFGLLKQKTKTRDEVIHDVEELLVKLKISEKRNALPKHLSGGQKRRVCLGMALVGNASTLILDEPTSGMDPETSRVTWEIILKFRKQKTIIITTHSMEEADVLGDRIAIMHNGNMKCYGTSMFLKKFYGKNYQEVTLSIESWYDRGKIQAIVGTDAKIDTSTYGRIVISIPMTDSLPETLDKIELMKAELGISGVSVSMITLEQVFLKAAEEEDEKEKKEDEKNEEISVPAGNAEEKELGCQQNVKLTGLQLKKQIFWALLAKKAFYAKNNRGILIGMVFGTLIAVILMPIFAMKVTSSTNYRPLSLSIYPNSEALIYNEDENLANTYAAVIEGQGGTATLLGSEVNILDALLEKATAGIVYYRNNIVVSAEFDSTGETITANGLYSGSATLSAPISVNVISNSLLKTFASDAYSITANIENLPKSLVDYLYDEFTIKSDNLLQMMLFISVFFIAVGLFVINPLMEVTTSVKQLQRMTGVSSMLYWGTMFIFDYGIYIIATIVTVLGFVIMDIIFQSKTYYSVEIGILSLLLLLFGINLLLLAYVFSFTQKPLYVVLLILCLANIIIAEIQVFINLALEYMESYGVGFLLQRRLFSLLPHVSFTFGFSKFLDVAANNARCRGLPNSFGQIACLLQDPCCNLDCADGKCNARVPYFGDFTADAGLEEFVLYLALTPIGFLMILFLLEHRAFGKLISKMKSSETVGLSDTETIDSDVVNEKRIVQQAINQREQDSNFEDENVFLAYELSKRYGKLQAVKEVNFRVMKNECFGLLGVNGAGKSTTFRMLVGEDVPTSGILIRGRNNIKINRQQYLAGIGYCPQINALIPSFNAYEHLLLFARLRGVPKAEVDSEVQLWIDKLRLNKHAKNMSKTYSGGNKRRLNIAMALIANPEMVLLDEPTAGVDPGARRSLWGVLQSCQNSGQAIILTSHSMEECEALCNRLLIMVRGQLVCVGASQQLKQRYGAGYDISIKLNPERSEEEHKKIKEKIQSSLTCELRDEHPGYLFYHILDNRTTWVKMFGIMNTLKSQHSCIEDFTVSSSTLEQLFIQFARSASGSTTVPNGVTNVLTNV